MFVALRFSDRRWVCVFGASLAAATLQGCLPAQPDRPLAALTVSTLKGVPAGLNDLAGRPAILLFWRSDCGPCLVELDGFAGLTEAARGARLMAVTLDESPVTAASGAADRVPVAAVWRATEPAGDVLTRFGGAPPRLPLAVALDAQGRVCATHHGILGTDRARDWVKQCS